MMCNTITRAETGLEYGRDFLGLSNEDRANPALVELMQKHLVLEVKVRWPLPQDNFTTIKQIFRL